MLAAGACHLVEEVAENYDYSPVGMEQLKEVQVDDRGQCVYYRSKWLRVCASTLELEIHKQGEVGYGGKLR